MPFWAKLPCHFLKSYESLLFVFVMDYFMRYKTILEAAEILFRFSAFQRRYDHFQSDHNSTRGTLLLWIVHAKLISRHTDIPRDPWLESIILFQIFSSIQFKSIGMRHPITSRTWRNRTVTLSQHIHDVFVGDIVNDLIIGQLLIEFCSVSNSRKYKESSDIINIHTRE